MLKVVGSRASRASRASRRSDIRSIDRSGAANDVELLAQIGYKQELDRHYSTLQVFGIAFSIMGLVPSITSTIGTGLESGASGFVWGWFLSGFFIFCAGVSMTILGSSIPTSGGLYYYTNYYAPDSIRVPLSFLIGVSNSMGLIGSIGSISYGFASEVLSAVYISMDGDFTINNNKLYGVFVACIISDVIVTCLAAKHAATLQTASIVVNVFLIMLFIIAIPVGVHKNGSFNDASFVFGGLENSRDWNQGWSFVLSWLPAVWTIAAFDSVIHCSEEAKDAQRAVPWGILGSISVCWVIGWVICIVCAISIKNGDVLAVLNSAAGNGVAQIIYDALGKQWTVAFFALISIGQYLMSVSIFIAASRQIWAFARDDGLPVVYNYVKVVNPTVKVPVRATVFAGILSILMGLLILIKGTAGSGALFSLPIASNMLSWATPIVLVTLPLGKSRFVPGPFTLGDTGNTIVHCISILWLLFQIIVSMFPNSKIVDKDTMNYTCVINVSIWALSLIYYYVHGYKVYQGPKSNLDKFDSDALDSRSFINMVDMKEKSNHTIQAIG